MNKKWIIYIVLLVIVFIVVVVFSKDIYLWMSNQLLKVLLFFLAFGAGWVLGRFGGQKNRGGNSGNEGN